MIRLADMSDPRKSSGTDNENGLPRRRIAAWSSSGVMLVSALVVVVSCVRLASGRSFTHDESLTWLSYVHLPFGDLIAHKETYTNNHMLNSILMKWSEAAFGSGELALRLPNLLGLLIFLVYGALLFRQFGHVIGTLTYICLCYTAGVMEFFSLARGYGLSFGFIFMAQFHAGRSLVTAGPRHALLTHAALVLAVLSSFVVLQYAVALVVVIPLVVRLLPEQAVAAPAVLKRAVRIHGMLLPLTVLALWEPVRRVVHENEFEFGRDGFLDGTFSSLAYAAFPSRHITSVDVYRLWFFFLFTTALAVAYFLVQRFGRNRSAHGDQPERIQSMLAWGVLPGAMVVMGMQHTILGTPYPEARFCMFLLPLFIVCMGALGAIAARNGLFWPACALLAWASFSSVRTFIERTNMRTSIEWQYDMDTKSIMEAVGGDLTKQRHALGTATIGHPWLLMPTVDYYRRTHRLHSLRPAHRNGPAWTEDYLVLADSMLAGFDSSCYVGMGHYPNAGLWLYRKGQ